MGYKYKKKAYFRANGVKRRLQVVLYAVLFLGILALSALYFRLTSTPG